MRYPPRDGDWGIVYTHCDGAQLKLSDSDRGSNTEYTATSYYEWNSGSYAQLLFIFPTRVSLTTRGQAKIDTTENSTMHVRHMHVKSYP